MILGLETHTIRRWAAGSRVNGVWVDGAESTFTIRGSLQPVDGDVLNIRDAGAHRSGKFWLFCDPRQPALRVVDPASSLRCDHVETNGRAYQVVEVRDWSADRSGAPHRAYLLAEIGDDE